MFGLSLLKAHLLILLQPAIQHWNKEKSNNKESNFISLSKELELFKTKLISNPSDPLLWKQEEDIRNTINISQFERELYWEERVKREWCTLGDKN